MPTAITPLANITLSSSAATVTFSSISGSYRDLMLTSVSNLVTAGNQMRIRFNSDTGTNYSYVLMSGYSSSSTYSASQANQTGVLFGWNGKASSLGKSMTQLHILDSIATDKHKTLLLKDHDFDQTTVELDAWRWASTSAITSITISTTGGDILAGSSFALYGISA